MKNRKKLKKPLKSYDFSGFSVKRGDLARLAERVCAAVRTGLVFL